MKKIIVITVLTVLFIFLTVFSCKPPAQKEDAQEETFGAAPVKVFKVKKQRISEKLLYTGTIEAWKKTNITPDIGGKIARILVEEGDRVKKGQLLAELDTAAKRLQLCAGEAASSGADDTYT